LITAKLVEICNYIILERKTTAEIKPLIKLLQTAMKNPAYKSTVSSLFQRNEASGSGSSK